MRSLICPSTPTSASSAFFCFFLAASYRSRPPGSPEAIIMVSLMNSAIVSAYDFCRISLYAGTSQCLTASGVNLGWLKSQRFFSLPPQQRIPLAMSSTTRDTETRSSIDPARPSSRILSDELSNPHISVCDVVGDADVEMMPILAS